ncbi:MAG: prolyl oligopeptidase family serine peptidase [bacterium]
MQKNMIGAYGPWAAGLVGDEPGPLSFRLERWKDVKAWRATARQKVLELISQPDTGSVPKASVKRQLVYDGLHIEELSWQLPYGPPTEAVFLKPEGARGKLPGILALHDHGGNKYFGVRKITRVSDDLHPMQKKHQDNYYGGVAWANEVAKRGYAVLVHDAFAFASRRVLASDMPDLAVGHITGRFREMGEVKREELESGSVADSFTVSERETEAEIEAYNIFAAAHENIMAKSLFCAGTTWPGVFSAEDQRALDYLCSRDDVDGERIGCGGLSGGGLRTVFLAGLDERIKCAVCVGFMTTWRDFLLNKCFTHTWMAYVPLLPKHIDFPEILGLRVPLPTLVLNTEEDPLYTLPEMRRADSILREIYSKAGALDNYRCSFYGGPHKFDLPMQAEAFDWFDRWMR